VQIAEIVAIFLMFALRLQALKLSFLQYYEIQGCSQDLVSSAPKGLFISLVDSVCELQNWAQGPPCLEKLTAAKIVNKYMIFYIFTKNLDDSSFSRLTIMEK
jgi:hypothetical protein